MWSTTDIKWLKEKYPGLKKISRKCLEGKVSFRMLRLNNEFFVNPTQYQIEQVAASDYLYLCGSYDIQIQKKSLTSFPIAREIGGKIVAVAKRLGKESKDMHLYPDGSLCLAAPMELDMEFSDGFNLKSYIEFFLVPYLFAQTYYAKNRIWIWGELSHGIWGLLEWLGRKKDYAGIDAQRTFQRLLAYAKQENADIKTLLSIRCRNHKPCPCGSNKKTKKCHPDVQPGITRLRIAINNGVISYD